MMQLYATLLHTSILWSLLAICCFAQTVTPTLPQFEDVTKSAGLSASHLGQPGNRYVIESTSGGVGFIDCDNDGRLDIVTVNGSSVESYRRGGDPMVTLYRQTADLQFTDITQAAG